jgi:arabinofuranan 3-O-arabinosyltransferase
VAITYYRTWRIISLILYTVFVIILAVYYRRLTTPIHILWAFAMTGIWYTLLMGQIYVVLLGLVVGAWISLEKEKTILAGVVIGVLAAIKPNFLVWPALLLLGGSWIPALGGLVTFGALSLLPLFVFGSGTYVQWLEMLASYRAAPLATNMSIYGFFSRLRLDHVGVIIAVVFLLILGIWVWRNNPESKMISSLAIAGALLATQFAWVGYAILLLPIFFYRRTSWMIALSAVLFCIPSILVYSMGKVSEIPQIFAGLFYFSALVFLMVELLFSTYLTALHK